ncbi:transketolase [Azotosporobacter soli]|uniref:transketolase n=1 Tax=Azotosporobacter soli TaxID=3055040 RepID=UPI0031FE52BD
MCEKKNSKLINIKKNVVKMTHVSKASHVGSCLSIVDILYVLYFKIMKIDVRNPQFSERDKFILSKGHASAALYATLAERGFFAEKILEEFYTDNGKLPGHLDKEAIPGVEVSSGSLGHGLSIGVGMALANKLQNNPGRIIVLLGDGECNEGSVWEAIMLAPNINLDNLLVIVDYNKLQGFGRTNEIIQQENIKRRWQEFLWEACEINGHNLREIEEALLKPQKGPKVIIAHTVKGNGVSFMEDKLEWHYKSPNEEQLEQSIRELDGL